MKQISPRISDKSADVLKKHFKTINAGAEYILDSLPNLFKFSQINMRDKFSKEELCLILDVMNATLLTPELCGRGLQMNIQDGIILDRLDEKWGVDAEKINSTIAELAMFEMFALEFWANGFWYGDDKNTADMDKYIADFIDQKTQMKQTL